MSTPLPPPIGTGFTSSPNASDYIDNSSKDLSQEIINNKIPQGSTWNKGVVLTKDSLDVPLEFAFGINNEHSESSRPTLSPLFRTRFVEDQKLLNTSQDYYEALRQSLPSHLRIKLEQDEVQIFEDRDPDLIALDNSLRFEANLLAIFKQLAIPVKEGDLALEVAQTYLNLPNVVKKEILTYSHMISTYVDRYLDRIGPNDPSYDLLINSMQQMKETIETLNELNTQ